MTTKLRSTGALCTALLFAGAAYAVPFTFQDISGTSAANNVADQISVDVVQGASAGTVRFNFTFAPGDSGILTAIGFGGSSASLITNPTTPVLTEGAGVDFQNGSPPSLGGGGFPQLFGVERETAGGVTNGLSIGETLGVQYTLSAGSTFTTIANAITAGTFNIGLHLQSLDNGDSQKAVIGPGPTPGPVPDSGTTIAMLGMGLLGLAVFRRFLR